MAGLVRPADGVQAVIETVATAGLLGIANALREVGALAVERIAAQAAARGTTSILADLATVITPKTSSLAGAELYEKGASFEKSAAEELSLSGDKHVRINSVNETAAYRVADLVGSSGGRAIVYEFKNAAQVHLTRQIQDFIDYSAMNGIEFRLVVRSGTRIKLDGPLDKELKKYGYKVTRTMK